MIDPLELTVELACPPAHAFDVWTTRISTWWPQGHSTSGDPAAEVVLEPGLGGRIFERLPDGTEVDWGEITIWDPPGRLGYLWHINRDRSEATDVELRFVAVDDDRTRLDIVHRGWERLGEDGRSWRDANTGGWSALLPHFVAAAEATAD